MGIPILAKSIKVNNYNQGFSLIEIIVILVIVGIVSSIALFNFGKYNKNNSLDASVLDLAIFMRQAQVYGISSPEDTSFSEPGSSQNGGTNSSVRVGLSFEYSAGFVPWVVMYRDVDQSQTFTENPTNDLSKDFVIDRYRLKAGERIAGICKPPSQDCEQQNIQASTLNIFFDRPDPTPLISLNSSSNLTEPDNAIAIEIQNVASNEKRFVILEVTGNIHVASSLN